MCRSTIMHVPQSCSDCQRYRFQYLWQIMRGKISVLVACKPIRQSMWVYHQSPTTPTDTLMLNCYWCLDSIFSAINHKLNVPGHNDMCIFSCFDMWNSCPMFVRTFHILEIFTLLRLTCESYGIYFIHGF